MEWSLDAKQENLDFLSLALIVDLFLFLFTYFMLFWGGGMV